MNMFTSRHVTKIKSNLFKFTQILNPILQLIKTMNCLDDAYVMQKPFQLFLCSQAAHHSRHIPTRTVI